MCTLPACAFVNTSMSAMQSLVMVQNPARQFPCPVLQSASTVHAVLEGTRISSSSDGRVISTSPEFLIRS